MFRYDYVGAPWNLKTNTPIIDLQAKGHLTSGSGNGGFSLRSVYYYRHFSNLICYTSTFYFLFVLFRCKR